MWSIINKDDYQKFIAEYPELADDQQLFTLHESNDKIFLPRFFFKNYPSHYIHLYDPTVEIQKINLKFNGEPRKNQIPLLNKIMTQYQTQGSLNGIIKCYCGFGKTACAINLATQIGLKTLFIVDKESLLDQWVQEISKFTNIQTSEVGLIKSKYFVVDNKPFVIAMVQTLLSKIKKDPKDVYQKMKMAGFGLVVYDEVHNTSASEQYSKSSVLMSAPNILGLSATPFKFGGQDILMRNVVGELLYNEKNYKLLPKISFHFYESGLGKYRYPMNKMDFVGSKTFYNKHIIESEKYLDLIHKYVKEDLKKGHKVIVLCWTENQVKTISNHLSSHKIKNRQFYGKSREYEKTDNVLVCTKICAQ